MNEQYAIDPNAPEDAKDVLALMHLFGMSNGRFIINFPSDWQLKLLGHAENFSAIDRKKIIECLKTLSDAFQEVDCGYQISKDWLSNAIDAKFRHGVHADILTAKPNDDGFDTLQKFLWETVDRADSRGAHISASISAYSNAVRPLFAGSTEVHIIDKFLKIRDDYGLINHQIEALLTNFFKLADESQRCEVLVIHFESSIKGQDSFSYERQIEEDLERMVDRTQLGRVEIRYAIHPKIQHGRYVISIKGGLQFDHGVAFLRRSGTNHVHWMSKGELLPLQAKYISNFR